MWFISYYLVATLCLHATSYLCFSSVKPLKLHATTSIPICSDLYPNAIHSISLVVSVHYEFFSYFMLFLLNHCENFLYPLRISTHQFDVPKNVVVSFFNVPSVKPHSTVIIQYAPAIFSQDQPYAHRSTLSNSSYSHYWRSSDY